MDERVVAAAAGGWLYEGWAYDGAGGASINGSFRLDVDGVTNTGSLSLAGNWLDLGRFSIESTTFNHTADDFHSGGVAVDFMEHGDTGVGNALLPAMHLLVATWGTGQILVNGTPMVDHYAGVDFWNFHAMVTDTGVRGADGRVTTTDGAGPYDPGAPGDALVGIDTEAMLVVTSTFSNETLPASQQTISGEVALGGSVGHPFEVLAPGAQLVITIDVGADVQELGPVHFDITDPDQNRVGQRASFGATRPQKTTETIELIAEKNGGYVIQARTEGAPADYDITIDIVYPPKPMYLMHFEDVSVGDAAG